MKFDTHCHVHEGSVDSDISVERYIKLLRDQGFDGMLITDHDSYGGYKYWRDNIRGKKYTDFVVLCGNEYDTFDAGHFVVVLPSGETPKLLEKKGMKLETLIDVVHSHGGILGPAHPFGENFLSIYNTGKYKKDRSITTQFDFIEGFNSAEDYVDNQKAVKIAEKYNKPTFAGSDSHNESSVGTAETVIDADIRSEDDLIRYIKEGGKPTIKGSRWYGTIKDHLGLFNKTLVYGFFFYNKAGAFANTFSRKKEYDDYMNKI
ncbi:MAG: PHP domain-containing protein [Lachnospiraceae bacterium]|nr:PHP domain-containing protein [Lachnospiraceae bacterium]